MTSPFLVSTLSVMNPGNTNAHYIGSWSISLGCNYNGPTTARITLIKHENGSLETVVPISLLLMRLRNLVSYSDVHKSDPSLQANIT